MYFSSSNLWLLLCYAQYAAGGLLEDYKEDGMNRMYPRPQTVSLPVELGLDSYSGCLCRATEDNRHVVCFGNYQCKKFPQISFKSQSLSVRTTSIKELRRKELDQYHYLKVLEIEANHEFTYLESGVFRNFSRLRQLSISFNHQLQSLEEGTFEGLTSLRNLTLLNNGFINLSKLTPEFKPAILPSLISLDLSANAFEEIPKDAFVPMMNSPLENLLLSLCRLDYVHPDSFLSLRKLTVLNLGDNELNASIITEFVKNTHYNGINLLKIDLSGMGFRKQPPKDLLNVIAETTIKILILSYNQFEIITDNFFPQMLNIELLDLRHILTIYIEPDAFGPSKFPNLKTLLLGGNYYSGIHSTHLSNQLEFLDLCCNKLSGENFIFEIDRNVFKESKELRILNLSYNEIKAVFNYTFEGLDKLRILDLENGTLYHIGDGTFKTTKKLEVLNLSNNPLTANYNLTGAQLEGLNNLKRLSMRGCGIRMFNDDDNIFEMTPLLTHLVLSNNMLYYLTVETIKPLKFLQYLDLSGNLFITWWTPLFLSSGVKPQKLFLTNNKISQFSLGMVQDISYMLENESDVSVVIDLMDNIFVCDCESMYKIHLWLSINGSRPLRQYFAQSQFLCATPDIWEDRRVAEYLGSIKSIQCVVYQNITNVMLFVWTAPSLISIAFLLAVGTIVYKYRIYIRYWIFLAKLAIGRKFIRNPIKFKNKETMEYIYDAFVSYSKEDGEFILDLIENLEQNPPFLKLCIYERDFEIGSFITESVARSINESRYIILVISNSFVKSQWCRWETQLAEYHRLFLEDDKTYDPLVLLKIGEVENKYLTATLRYLLKTKIYLSWSEENQEMFWKKLKNLLSKKS